VFAPNHQNT
jgi:hypothetical protein